MMKVEVSFARTYGGASIGDSVTGLASSNEGLLGTEEPAITTTGTSQSRTFFVDERFTLTYRRY